MSYLWIGLIGAAIGLVAGQFVIGSRQGIAIDAVAGAIGAWLAVVLSRIFFPEAAGGIAMSAIVAVIGAVVMLFVMNRFIRATVISLPRPRRRL